MRTPKKNQRSLKKEGLSIQKNSTLYFQVGLIICLLITYGLLEMKFESKDYAPQVLTNLEEDDIYVFDKQVKIYQEEVKEKKKKPTVFKDPKISDDDDEGEVTPDIVTEPVTNEPVADPGSIVVEKKPDDLPPVSIMAVEQVPVFPGCEDETSNKARIKCMSEKISKHIKRKFDTDIASDLGLSGLQRINVMFKVDKNGEVTDIKARSPYKQLDNEAKRVIGKLPNMQPGKQDKKAVDVVYGLPIMFQVQN
ncbi:energy transducer TonB [Mangrovimonas cancribranchiae]|uniref:Energy transducer TonB n=1 Tax=Mangrovimonas cancribranchiae TaxID=3080055 RepID=A0AAU6NWW5_9FLAO